MTTTLVACCAAITKDMLVAAALGVTSQSVYCSKKAALDTLRRAFGLRQEGLR